MTPGHPLPLSFIVVPFIIWGAFRFTQREVTTLVGLVSMIAIGYTLAGHGSFVADTLNESLLLLLAFVSTVVVTGLVLAASQPRRSR